MTPVRVLQSFGRPGPRTNPYIVMLGDSLARTPDLELVRFSWRAALVGRYDVVHLHWPEVLMEGRDPLRSAGQRVAFAALLTRVAVTRTPVVRTVHNLELPQDVTRFERFLLTRADRMTTFRILLNDHTDVPSPTPSATILHGDYRDWFAPYARRPARPGHLAFVGLVRRYKGVERLLEVFAQTAAEEPGLTLTVAGRPSSVELEQEIRAVAARDPRVSTLLTFLTDEELVGVVTDSELVILPYRFMHNSGTVLAALSLARPVLVPRTEVNEALGREVGPGWVNLFDADLDVEVLLDTARRVRDQPPRDAPDLSARGWAAVGAAHLEAYRRALADRHGPRRTTAPAAVSR